MPLLTDSWTGLLDKGDPADGPRMKAFLDAILACINNLDNNNIAAAAAIDVTKLGSGVLVHHQGAATGQKYLSGSKDLVLVSGTKSAAVSFSTDADVDGPAGTDFSSAPRVFVAAVSNSTTKIFDARLEAAPTTSGFSIRVTSSDLADTSTITVHWIAVGAGTV